MTTIFNDRNEKVICDRCDNDQFKVFALNATEVAICNRCGIKRTIDEWMQIKPKSGIFRESKRGLFE